MIRSKNPKDIVVRLLLSRIDVFCKMITMKKKEIILIDFSEKL